MRFVKFIGGAIVVVGGFFVLSWLLVPFLTSDTIQTTIESFGVFGPLALIGYTTLSHIVAPLAGTPGFLVGVTVFGVERAIMYIYIGSMISASANFFIGRRFGRSIVSRFVGKSSMHKVDSITTVAGPGILAVLRLLGIAVFEEISYAAGLTNMRFREYILITIFASIPPHALLIIAFRNADFSQGASLAMLTGALLIAGILAALLIHYYVKREQKRTLLSKS